MLRVGNGFMAGPRGLRTETRGQLAISWDGTGSDRYRIRNRDQLIEYFSICVAVVRQRSCCCLPHHGAALPTEMLCPTAIHKTTHPPIAVVEGGKTNCRGG